MRKAYAKARAIGKANRKASKATQAEAIKLAFTSPLRKVNVTQEEFASYMKMARGENGRFYLNSPLPTLSLAERLALGDYMPDIINAWSCGAWLRNATNEGTVLQG